MPAVLAAPAITGLMPGDPGWDNARRAWSLSVDRHPSVQTAMSPWAARQMYLNLAETRRRPGSFWTPEAYDRLRRIKAAVDPGNLIRSNHPIPPLPEGTAS
jgi:hypothetical protein